MKSLILDKMILILILFRMSWEISWKNVDCRKRQNGRLRLLFEQVFFNVRNWRFSAIFKILRTHADKEIPTIGQKLLSETSCRKRKIENPSNPPIIISSKAPMTANDLLRSRHIRSLRKNIWFRFSRFSFEFHVYAEKHR